MSRYMDDWVEDRLVFTLYGDSDASSCSCGCGPIELIEAMALSEYMNNCSEMEEEDVEGQKEFNRISQWPVAVKEKVWRSRVILRAALKSEKRKLAANKEGRNKARIMWAAMSLDERAALLRWSVKDIHSWFYSLPGVDREFVSFLTLILEQLARLRATSYYNNIMYETNGDKNEIAFQQALAITDDGSTLFVCDSAWLASAAAYPAIEGVLDTRGLLTKNNENISADADGGANAGAPYRMLGQKMISSFRSDRRLLRLMLRLRAIKQLVNTANKQTQTETLAQTDNKQENTNKGGPDSTPPS